MTEEIKAVSYCVGMSIAGSLIQQDLEGISPEIMAEAIADAFSGREPKYTPELANSIIQNYLQSAGEAKFAQNKKQVKHSFTRIVRKKVFIPHQADFSIQ